MAKGRKKDIPSGMSARFCGFWSLLAGFHQRMCQSRLRPRFFETACCPLDPEDVSWRKKSLSADLTPVYTIRTTQWLLAEFHTKADWLPYLLDLNTLDFAIWRILQMKGPGYASCQSGLPMSYHGHGMGLVRGGIHLRDLPLIPLLPSVRKIKFKSDKWAVNSPTYTSHQQFSGAP